MCTLSLSTGLKRGLGRDAPSATIAFTTRVFYSLAREVKPVFCLGHERRLSIDDAGGRLLL